MQNVALRCDLLPPGFDLGSGLPGAKHPGQGEL